MMNSNQYKCSVDARQLLEYLDDPTCRPELQEHVDACERCQFRLLQIAAAAVTRGADRNQCQARALPIVEYACLGDAAFDKPQLRELQDHLALCDTCFSLYRELRAVVELVMQDLLPAPPAAAYRAPNLEFLHPPFRWEEAKDAAGLMVRTLRVYLAGLFVPKTPLGAVVRAEAPEQGAGHEITLGAEVLATLDVTVTAGTDPQDAGLATLRVRVLAVTAEARGAEGVELRLRFAGGCEFIRYTDTHGMASFDSLPKQEIAAATLDITPRR
jgi:hypothetical protein